MTSILNLVEIQRPRFMPKVLNKHHQNLGQEIRLINVFALQIVFFFHYSDT